MVEILQITSANGWFVIFEDKEGDHDIYVYVPLVAWALVEGMLYEDLGREKFVSGVYVPRIMSAKNESKLCIDTSVPYGYRRERDLKMTEEEQRQLADNGYFQRQRNVPRGAFPALPAREQFNRQLRRHDAALVACLLHFARLLRASCAP